MIHLHPYKLGSASAKALKEYILERGHRAVISHRLASNRPRFIVGWGAKPFDFNPGNNRVMNDPQATRILSCKKRFFEHVNVANPAITQFIPSWTADRAVAAGWGTTVVARATTTGSGGEGITIVNEGDNLPVAPLYVKYQKKTAEYRLHAFKVNGEWVVKHIQRKVFVATPERPEPLNWQVRNHTQGFIFQTEEGAPEAVTEATLAVCGAFAGVSMMALDVIYHAPSRIALVLEANTAPGLEGPRLNVYGDYIIEQYRNA